VKVVVILYSVFLGLIQGSTEFLPISSSAHLILAEYFFEVKGAGLAFDVILHLATLTAILGYFRKDFFAIALAFSGKYRKKKSQQRTLGIYLCWATLPALLFGMTMGKYAETVLRSPGLIAFTLSLAGAILWWAEKIGSIYFSWLDSWRQLYLDTFLSLS